MKPYNLGIGMILVLIVAGFVYTSQSQDDSIADPAIVNEISDTQIDREIETDREIEQPSDDRVMDVSSYLDYSESNLKLAQQKEATVLFFAATDWCQTCAALDEEIISRIQDVPEEMTILKVDYDNDKQMRNNYKVTAQHTLIVLDSEGNEVKRWLGGGLDTLLSQVETN